MKKLIASLFVFCGLCNVALADAWTDCGAKIVRDAPQFATGMREMVNKNSDYTPAEVFQKNSEVILTTLAAVMFDHEKGVCNPEIIEIAKFSELKLSFDIDGVRIPFNVNVDNLFDYAPVQTEVMVYNNRTKKIWDTITATSIQDKYWTRECSQWNIALIKNNTAVSNAGRAAFSEYGGTENHFFLDFEESKSRQRAFPGLVIMDKKASTRESLVVYTHLPTAIKRAQEFANSLQNTACGNQNLAVYLVSAAGTPWGRTESGNTTRDIAAVVGIASTTVMAIGGTIAAATALFSAAGAAAATSNPIGWGVGAILAIAGGVVSLWPADIADFEQVYVLDGPYLIR